MYFLFIHLTSLAAVSVAFAISAAVRATAIANLLIAMVFVVSMVSSCYTCHTFEVLAINSI